MKKALLSFSLAFCAMASHAQWTTGTGNINNTNTGNVGIGTTAPASKLSVNPSITGTPPTNTATSLSVGNSTSTLADAAGSYLYPFEVQHLNTGHSGRLQFTPYRRIAGNSWQGTAYRMQYVYDLTGTGGQNAYIEVGSSDPGLSGGNFISLGTGGVDRLSVSNNGNIGVGTTTPVSLLDVSSATGTATITPTTISITSASNASDWNTSTSWANLDFTSRDGSGIGAGAKARIGAIMEGASGGGVGMAFYTSGGVFNEKMRITNTGNVGIGISNPTDKLAVNGTIHSKEVKVDLLNWPDYVFDRGYKLPSLQEIKAYIDANHHLPDVPSAKEVEKDGLLLGEMNKVLLKKVEELTLHLLAKDEEIKAQSQMLKSHQKLLTELQRSHRWSKKMFRFIVKKK
jgi:hypothetical protein